MDGWMGNPLISLSSNSLTYDSLRVCDALSQEGPHLDACEGWDYLREGVPGEMRTRQTGAEVR